MTPVRPLPGVPLPAFRPGLWLTLPFLLGIAAVDSVASDPGWIALGMAAVTTLLLAAALLRFQVARLAALLALTFLGGALRMSLHLELPGDHVSIVAPSESETAFSAVVVSEPVFWKRPSLRDPPPGAPEPGSYTFEADVDCILSSPPRPVTGRIRVSAFTPLPPLLPGDRIRIRGLLRAPRDPRNPGQFDYAARLRRLGIHRVISLTDPTRLEVVESPAANGFERTIARIRRRLLLALGASLRPDTTAFLGALLLGVQGDLPDDVETAFRRTGTYHLIAISGFHLVLLWGAMSRCFAVLGVSGRPSRIIILAVLAGYTILTGLLASAVRSFLMVAAVIGADLAGRRRDSLSSLSFAALAIVAVDPVQVFDAGFQLSFLAVFGILWIYPPLRALVSAPHDPIQGLLADTRGRRLRKWLSAQARDGVCVSMAAWLITNPLVAVRFHLLTPVTNAANLILCPLVAVELVGAAVKTATGLAGGLPDVVLGKGLEVVYDAMACAARLFAAIPGAWVPVAGLASIGIVLYALELAVWVRFCRVPRPRPALLGFAVAVATLGFSRVGPSPPDGFLLTTLDVGQGSAHVCETPEGGVVVFDCGSSGYPDPGRSVVAPYLWSRGLTAIDLLILSHPDGDHINGTAFLAENVRIGAVAVSSCFARFKEGSALLRKLEQEGVLVIPAGSGSRIEGIPGASIQILGPRDGTGASRLSGNGTSLAVRIRCGGGTVLFTGDIDAKGLAALPAASIPGLAADVIAVPHHGSPGSRSPLLVRSAGARYALVSARRGFASKNVLDDYRDAGSAILATWEEGAVRMEQTPQGWAVRTWKGEGHSPHVDAPGKDP